VAYLGPTNSGKTYQAMQALQQLTPHEHGVYLAPLRLLAIEVCENLRAQGLKISLVTGEEREIVPGAQVVCSTIEMLDTEKHYAVAVIDEMQMIADTQRGWAWTQALFEVSAARVFVLGSSSAEALIKDFCKTSGDALVLHHTQRFNPLQVQKNPVYPKAITKGSIFVVFSRNAVIRWGEYFRASGLSVAQIYGALPPEVRREEARRFRSGEAQILVATDAVAMGLNLPAHTVVLGEGEKYNGYGTAPVPAPLIRQIAGRAGRYGHHDAGFAAGADPDIHLQIRRALEGTDKRVTFPDLAIAPTRAWVTQSLAVIPDITVRELLTAWRRTVEGTAWFRCVDLDEISSKATILDNIPNAGRISMAERLQMLTAPADMRSTGQMLNFRLSLITIIEQKVRSAPFASTGPHARTEDLEQAYKDLSLYCWFHFRYPTCFPEIEKAKEGRRQCVDQLIAHIRQGLKRHCKTCGKALPAKGVFGICESCFQAQRRQRQWDRDDDY
jgi:ATP-dependent RNA helicase SUPV3L1/SUV3